MWGFAFLLAAALPQQFAIDFTAVTAPGDGGTVVCQASVSDCDQVDAVTIQCPAIVFRGCVPDGIFEGAFDDAPSR